ncbi:Ribonuclease VapC3 [ANME-1 cluster archaeon GoMg3.2]|nr:Ribonuclease VapC3 [ANME-1 cluster archaeon GoMg3.2]
MIINLAVALAFEYNITVYDAFYIALAKDLELTFITADRRLCERVRGRDYVEFIGEM